MTFLHDVPRKVSENSVFSRFSRHFLQSSQKMRKNMFFFFSFLQDVPQKKKWDDSIFSRFSRHFVQSSQKMRKTAFFEHFARCPAKSVRKHCFFHVIRDTLYNVRLKFEKNDVFWAYARLSTKSFCVKSVFTRFLRHFVRFCKKCDKQRSLIVLRDVPQKLWEKWVFFFHFFRDIIYKVRINAKNSVFYLYAWRSAKSVRKQFFTFFETFVESSPKMQKTVFFELFARSSGKSFRKHCFSRFSRRFVIKFAKNAKKQCFLSFFVTFHKSLRKQCFFSRFSRQFVQSSQKMQKKNSVYFELFARVPPRLGPYMIEPTRLSPHDCAHTRLCPHTIVPRHVCAQTRLCPDTIVPRHDCAQTRLCPHTFVPTHDCGHTRLCPHMIVPTHDCAQTRLCPHTIVPTHDCAHTRLCPDTFVPTHICAQTRLCPHTIVPTHVCALICYTFSDIFVFFLCRCNFG